MQNPVPVGRALSDRRMGDLGLRRPSLNVSEACEREHVPLPNVSHMSPPHLKERDLAQDPTTYALCHFLASKRSHVFARPGLWRICRSFSTTTHIAEQNLRGNEEPTREVRADSTILIRGLLPSPRGCDKRLQILICIDGRHAAGLMALVSIDL